MATARHSADSTRKTARASRLQLIYCWNVRSLASSVIEGLKSMHMLARVALLCLGLPASALAAETFPSTYQVPVNPPLLIQGATVLTGTGERLDGADVLIADGRIQAVGKSLTAPADARTVDAHGRWVTPGVHN